MKLNFPKLLLYEAGRRAFLRLISVGAIVGAAEPGKPVATRAGGNILGKR